ncbi:hypothetical protein [Pontixanthobacter aquaemixtae]|uniref:Uncharacterized protein n=1 Tax=Pontixanthobacter aquaemixtae TaxID=1958940 RepID=A0A844ZQB2_9SPHN|nr:hypothetical protein [Pontixanthobacter aquaemixtae]MXO89532.1 hypothetical protein [Pontixanthobacter aquaemixtae]
MRFTIRLELYSSGKSTGLTQNRERMVRVRTLTLDIVFDQKSLKFQLKRDNFMPDKDFEAVSLTRNSVAPAPKKVWAKPIVERTAAVSRTRGGIVKGTPKEAGFVYAMS